MLEALQAIYDYFKNDDGKDDCPDNPAHMNLLSIEFRESLGRKDPGSELSDP